MKTQTWFLLAFLLILKLSIQQDQCQRFRCDDDLPDKVCAKKANNLIIHIRPCPNNELCNIYTDDTSYCLNEEQSSNFSYFSQFNQERKLFGRNLQPNEQGLPGENCNKGPQCFSRICEDNICQGKNQGEECFSDEECDVGTFCNNNNICSPQIEIGQDCSSTAKCVNWGMCLKGKCIQKRSLNVTKEIEHQEQDELCYNNFYIEMPNQKLQCWSGPFLNSSHVRTMKSGICQYLILGNQNGNPEYSQENSECGISDTYNSYCPLQHGDQSYLRYLNIVQKFWSLKPQCHISNPLGCQRAFDTFGYYTTIGSAYELKFFAQLQQNPECFKNMTYHYEYWNSIRPKMLKESEKEEEYNIQLIISFLGILSTLMIYII